MYQVHQLFHFCVTSRSCEASKVRRWQLRDSGHAATSAYVSGAHETVAGLRSASSWPGAIQFHADARGARGARTNAFRTRVARTNVSREFARRTQTTCERTLDRVGSPKYSLTITNSYVAELGLCQL